MQMLDNTATKIHNLFFFIHNLNSDTHPPKTHGGYLTFPQAPQVVC